MSGKYILSNYLNSYMNFMYKHDDFRTHYDQR